MMEYRARRRTIVLGFVLAVSALATGVWRYGYLQALDQLAKRAEADLALASDRLSTQLQVFQELAVLMADHPQLEGLEDPARRPAAQALLLEVADKTGALDVVFADRSGKVLAAAQGSQDRDLSDTVYFRRAMQGALGSDHGLRPPLDRRVYTYAAPVFAEDGRVRGALVVVADVENIERTWRGSTPAVFFTDASGQVFITNRSEILFWSRARGQDRLVTADGRELPFQAGMTGPHEVWTLGWGPYLPRRALHLEQDLPVIGMTGEVLLNVAPARRLAGLQAAAVVAICLAFGAMLFLATERRRALAQANAELESRVRDRTQALSATNVQLRREVAERQEAERALKKAQAELVQAGKLSALGQMSAGISHELNQPLMAIQQYADNGAAFLERGKPEAAAENLGRISGLAARAARIIKNLRAFARNESEPMGKVDLARVIDSAVEMTEPRLVKDGITLQWHQSGKPVFAFGGEVRLVQVFVNLINNAADAMAAQNHGAKVIRIVINDSRNNLTVTVRDTGPGIADPDRIFEPFYTTKETGSDEGMGLGLSISYGLVQSFGGKIRGANVNGPDGGAMFTVELDYWREEQAA
ncbi:GHKL domain-containing protein [Seohaeicola saemankumensis]|nr:ATP-binding protein [Seohaeicola saemankumensis]MCA0870273.1 GHKL domain-containing protein [Seohaeicola saemankumensis]